MKINLWVILLIITSSADCFVLTSNLSKLRSIKKRDSYNNTCSKVYDIPRDEQCSFVLNNCNTDENKIGRIDYLSTYYCNFKFLKSLSILPSVFALIVFFSSLGQTASDYLCPNLYTISKFLKLSDNLAGLTLLALGNGSPDVLSTYQAMSLDSGSLAISELLGASLFITTVVIGSMAVIHPFEVPRKSFIRDVGFFLGVSSLVFFSLFNSYLSLINCIVLVVVYIIYVLAVILSHSLLKFKTRKKLRDQRSRGNYLLNSDTRNNEDIEDIYLDTFATLPTIEELNLTNNRELDEENEIINNEYNDFLKSHSSSASNKIPVQAGSYGLKVLLKKLGKHSHVGGSIYLTTQRPLTAPVVSPSSQLYDNDEQVAQTYPSTNQPYRNETPTEQERIEELEEVVADDVVEEYQSYITYHSQRTKIFNFFRKENSILIKLFLPSIFSFNELNLVNKIYLIISLPISVLLRVSNPVRYQSIISLLQKRERSQTNFMMEQSHVDDEEDEEEKFDFKVDKLLLTIQSFVSLNFINYVLFNELDTFRKLIFPIGLMISSLIAFLIRMNYQINDFSPASLFKLKFINYFSSFIGFISSISWISLFATEIISILRSIAIIYNLSDDILGITVFALGNSIGDFISNFTIAKMGMPMMAFGACFGGPLLSICSMGVSGLILIPKQNLIDGYKFELSRTITITNLALILNIVLILIIVPKNNWFLDKKIGTILICNWILTTTFCILSELFK